MNIKKVLVIATLPVLLLLGGCATTASGNTDSSASVAKSTPEPKSDPLLKGFGDVITYDDGVSISVSKPAAFNPSPYAAGKEKGKKSELFTIVITNHSDDVVDLTPLPQMTSGGKQAGSITDLDSKTDAGDTPSTKLLPGKSITWNEGFAIADISDMQMQVSPGFEYDDAIFDTGH